MEQNHTMNQILRLCPALLILLLAGCADTENVQPKKKAVSTATNSTPDTQFTADASATNANPPPDAAMMDTNTTAQGSVSTPANPFPTATPVPVAPPRDLPYGTPVPGKPGFVTSPHSPSAGYVDVRGFPPGSEVKDPYSGKIFLVP